MEESNDWIKFFSGITNPFFGFTTSYETAKELIEQFQISTNTRYFSKVMKHKRLDQNNISIDGHCIRFDDFKNKDWKIECDNVPFICSNIEIFKCHREGKKRVTRKNSSECDHNYDDRSNVRRSIRRTKKQDCLAKIIVREIIRFPTFKTDKLTARIKKKTSLEIRNKLKESPDSILTEKRYYVYLPQITDHNHDSKITEDCVQRLDKRLKNKIYELVNDGVDNTIEIKRYLNEFLNSNKNSWFQDGNFPSRINKRFYPNNNTIRNHVNLALEQLRYSKIDQEHVQQMIEQWKIEYKEDMVYFKPFVNSDNHKSSLLFIFQSKNQKNLLHRYGNEACLMDATYKTSKYALPLFCIVVKTNVDYQPVAIFITMNETIQAITEPLQILRNWNPAWNPKYFMTDFSEAEIKAVEAIFPATDTYFCDFHKEQSWLRWLKTKEHGVYSKEEELLKMLRDISHSENKIDFEQAVAELKKSNIWETSTKFQDYFTKKWEPYITKWVWYFRKEQFIINIKTNNGVESLNSELKNCYLRHHKDKSLSGILGMLRDQFFTEKFHKYVEKNMSCLSSVKGYNKEIPVFLNNRPQSFITHCLKRISNSELVKNVVVIQKSQFMVQSEGNPNRKYKVCFANNEGNPSCECLDWKKNRWPCKHMFAVLRETKQPWESIGMNYINSVFHILDESVTSYSTSLIIPSVNDDLPSENDEIIELDEDSIQYDSETRVMLREVINNTYNITDQDKMEQLYNKVKDLFTWSSSIIEKNISNKRVSDTESIFSELPVKKKKQ